MMADAPATWFCRTRNQHKQAWSTTHDPREHSSGKTQQGDVPPRRHSRTSSPSQSRRSAPAKPKRHKGYCTALCKGQRRQHHNDAAVATAGESVATGNTQVQRTFQPRLPNMEVPPPRLNMRPLYSTKDSGPRDALHYVGGANHILGLEGRVGEGDVVIIPEWCFTKQTH